MSNPTPTRGVTITLDKERRLRYSLRTLRELNTEFGAQKLAEGLPTDLIAKFLWYGLRHEDPELTPEMVEEMVDLENLQDILPAIGKATGGRTPGVGTPQAPPVPAAPAPVGEVAGAETKTQS